MKNVSVNNEKGIVIDKKKIKKIIAALKKELGFSFDFFELNFVSSQTITSINSEYLHHNYSTDIITFNYSGESNNFDAEVFISLPDAVENSKKYKVSIENELLRLIIHGILHLIGFDDTTPLQKRKMKSKENQLLKKLTFYSKGLLRK